jgi:hypothetical protein
MAARADVSRAPCKVGLGAMQINEPRPRGTVVGERADRRRVGEAENFFRCNICGGYLDAQDYVWFWITKARCRIPAQDQPQ